MRGVDREIGWLRVFTLAHVSDWHTTTLVGARVRELATKRFWGWQSWQRSRRRRHRPEVLERILADVCQQSPDHVVVTGDLTNIALEQEFVEARGLLERFGTPDQVTLVPGNHDAYVSVAPDRGWDQWSPYLLSDGCDPGPAPTHGDYPTLRVRGPLAIIGLCTAHPTPLFMASGSLGEAQLARLEVVLRETRERGLTRVVALHHPPTDLEIARRRRLLDWQPLQAVVARAGAELVVHGHRHRSWLGSMPGPEGAVPIAGVRSASDVGSREGRGAQYHLYHFEPGRPPRLEVRGFDPVHDCVVGEGDRQLVAP